MATYIGVWISEYKAEFEDSPWFQECITLVWASSREDAKSKLQTHIESSIPEPYLNEFREAVLWTLKDVYTVQSSLNTVDNIEAPVDLYVRSFDDYALYRSLFEAQSKSLNSD